MENTDLTNIKIESNVPIPSGGRKGHTIELLKKLKVGDSFVVPKIYRANISNIATQIKMKVATRSVNNEMVRIWRTK